MSHRDNASNPSQPPEVTVAGRIQPGLTVFGEGTRPSAHRPLLLYLERELSYGQLKDSELGPLVLDLLRQETELRLAEPLDLSWISVGIRLGDYYFMLVSPSAGTRDWQRDFSKAVTPILVAMSQTLRRSADAHAVIIKLCERIAQRLRLTIVWPPEPGDVNDLKNEIYLACLMAHEVESDEVLIVLNGLEIIGPN